MFQGKIHGLGCCWVVADYFWNIYTTENGDSLPGAEDSGEGELYTFKVYTEDDNAHDKALYIGPFLSNSTTQRQNWCKIGSTRVSVSIGSFSSL